jgi:helicase
MHERQSAAFSLGILYMPPVIRIKDQNDCVNTEKFPLGKFPFPNFNPVQSRIFEVYNKDANCVISAATSAGKTVCAEMFALNEVKERGGKAIYLVPLKALAKEKIDDWTGPKSRFAGLNLSICTGDYRLTAERKTELENADVIVMTSEMLNSRCRNFNAEQNEFLKKCGTIIVDESHLLTVPGRGDHLEVGLMKFAAINPSARVVLLSATMPNNIEIAEWLGYVLTGKDTFLLESEFRPCPLGIHYENYFQARNYEATEEEKVSKAMEILEDHPRDKFIVFAHTKRTGEMMRRSCQKAGIKCEFHNADLEKNARESLEHRFRSDPDFKVCIATSTLAWGLNMPARRVIILGVHRGLGEVEPYEIWQMAGRAGRVGLDPRGDVYILLPEQQERYQRDRINKSYTIQSRLLDYVGNSNDPHYKTLAFHLVSEIHHGEIKSREDIFKWYRKSLAHYQAQDLDDSIVEATMNLLLKCGAIQEQDGELKVSPVGRISSMFYYSPFDVSDLKRNLQALFESGAEYNDLAVSMAMGDVDTLRQGIVSKAEKQDMETYFSKMPMVAQVFGRNFNDASVKGGFAYFCLLNGHNAGSLNGFVRNVQFDYPRMLAVVEALDSMAGRWGKREWMNTLDLRLKYGVHWDLVPFCRLPEVGKVRAERLRDYGFKSYEDVINQPEKVQSVLNMNQTKVDAIIKAARNFALKGI